MFTEITSSMPLPQALGWWGLARLWAPGCHPVGTAPGCAQPMGSLAGGATAAASGLRCSQRDASETPAGIPGRRYTKRKQAPDKTIGK